MRGADNSFIVEMPGEPVYKVIDTTIAARGTAFAYHSYSLEYRRLSFVAQTALYPADVDVRQPGSTCSPCSTTARSASPAANGPASTGATCRARRPSNWSAPCAAAACCASSSLLKGRRFVSLAYLAPADAMRTPEAERFFKSLRLGA